MDSQEYTGLEIAIVGMACRFPGAETPQAFWENLKAGVESVAPVTDLDLLVAGVNQSTIETCNYVRAASRLEDVDKFDASFFGITAREARAMDPQHRLFLECAWEALEDSGHASTSQNLRTGIVAGSGPNTYFTQNVVADHNFQKEGMLDSMQGFQAMLGNDKDYLPTRLAYKLGLNGPAINIQTACSTSLVSIHMACRMLLLGECDLALAGGSTVLVPDGAGYIYQDAMILSADGHCRPFDAKANGTVFGSGVATLSLRRLKDAMADGDRIHGVIKGSAINNDGDDKVSFSAPSINGQSEVIQLAMQAAEIEPESISYVEAHGTGTILGDPIEIAALTQAFSERPENSPAIPIGSVKANVGHLIAAAGVASVIKVIMSMKHRTIAPMINYDIPNPEIDFKNSPFYVNQDPIEWNSVGPRRAGVSSFGVGGTNAHVILEEAPTVSSSQAEAVKAALPSILPLSARSKQSLVELADRAASAMEARDHSLQSLCFTAANGRRAFEYRMAVSGRSHEEVANALRAKPTIRKLEDYSIGRRVVGLFTGQGSQYGGMGRDLYEHEPVFRKAIQDCHEILDPLLDQSLISVLYERDGSDNVIDMTAFTQPALFSFEYSLYKLWQSRGVTPDTVIGHSVGEYVAACVADVFNLKDGLKLIAKRGALMQSLPQNGAMLSITSRSDKVAETLQTFADDVSIAAINSPNSVVVSGAKDTIVEVQSHFENDGVKTSLLNVSHAFHSPLMDPILQEFETFADQIPMQAPTIDVISNVTGAPISEEITQAKYWAEHIRRPVLFAKGIRSVEASDKTAFLEYGPQPVLTGLGQSILADCDNGDPSWVPSLRRDQPDLDSFATATCELYSAGVDIDWTKTVPDSEQRVVDFPTYPFQRERHWIDNGETEEPIWHCVTEYEQIAFEPNVGNTLKGIWLVCGEDEGVAGSVAEILRTRNSPEQDFVHTISPSVSKRKRQNSWHCSLDDSEGLAKIYDAVTEASGSAVEGVVFVVEQVPDTFVDVGECSPASLFAEKLHGLVSLLQATEAHTSSSNPKLWLITQSAEPVDDSGKEPFATPILGAQVLGLGRVIENEHPDLWGGSIDLSIEPSEQELTLVPTVLTSRSIDRNIVIRGGKTYAPRIADASIMRSSAIKVDPEKTYVVTGGLGGLGYNVAKLLIKSGARRLVLLGRKTKTAKVKKTLAALENGSLEVVYKSIDISNYQKMKPLFDELVGPGSSLGGIVHTAGIVEDGMLSTMQDTSAMQKVLNAKLEGSLVLDRLSRNIELDFFVCFSSVSARLGMKGQASYVAANCAMNRIVELRNAEGLPGVSIEWGPWSQVGMAAKLDPKLRDRLSRFGLFSIEPERGLACLTNLISQTGTITAAPILWRRYASVQYGKVPPILEKLSESDTNNKTKNDDDDLSLSMMVANRSETDPQSAVLEIVREKVTSLLGENDIESLPIDEPLNRMGFDSLTTIEFRNSLVKLGVKISLEKLVMGATVSEISEDLLIQIAEEIDAEQTPASPNITGTGDKEYDKSCVIIPKPNPDAKVRLIGFPYAGGGPLVFQSWVNKLPDFVELGILQLPGRSARLRENFYTRMEEMVDHLVPDILPFVDMPFAFFGHCVGGVQSFEVAQKLRTEYGLEPEYLFVAGGRSPQIYNEEQFAIDVQQFNHETGKAEHELDEEDFVEMLREVNFANNKALFEDKEMRDLMLPIIQCDYEINNYYRYGGHPPLDTPITAIGGRIDPYVTGEHINGWGEHTTKTFKTQFCAGDHYFMEHQGDLLTGIAERDLKEALFSSENNRPTGQEKLEAAE